MVQIINGDWLRDVSSQRVPINAFYLSRVTPLLSLFMFNAMIAGMLCIRELLITLATPLLVLPEVRKDFKASSDPSSINHKPRVCLCTTEMSHVWEGEGEGGGWREEGGGRKCPQCTHVDQKELYLGKCEEQNHFGFPIVSRHRSQ